MAFRPYSFIEPPALSRLVIDSPHSGRDYPTDFAYTCPTFMLQQTEDSYVDELIAGAPDIAILTAEFPRSYIDVNRTENDIDPAVLGEPWPVPLMPSERTRQGLGLVRRLCRNGIPVYRAPLAASEIRKRIETCYRPYHAALDRALAARQAAFGTAYLIDCHSMPNRFERGDKPHADFVLGDRDGTSCDPAFTSRVRDILQDLGYSVALNDPFKGMEIVRRYGEPDKGRHALQLEINRTLYMNEDSLEKHDGFAKLRTGLMSFFRILVAELSHEIPDRLAAE